jgi:MATE family multidrug resistance protein
MTAPRVELAVPSAEAQVRPRDTSAVDTEPDERDASAGVAVASPASASANDSSSGGVVAVVAADAAAPDDFDTTILSLCSFPPGYSFWRCTKSIAKQSAAASLSQLLSFCNVTVTMMAIGRNLGINEIAAVGVAISTFNVCALSVCIGFASALDTLCSQAYGRDKTGTEVGELTQLGVVISIALTIPGMVFFTFFSRPFVAAVFGEVYSEGASSFLSNASPHLLMLAISSCFVKSLQAQQRADVPMKGSIVGTVVTSIAAFTLVPRFGVAGAAYGLACGSFATLICNVFILAPATALFRRVSWLPPRDYARIFTWARIKEYLLVGGASVLSVCSEWYAFEIMVWIASRVGQRETAAFNIFMSVASSCWCLTSGLATAASSNVGKLLGEEQGPLALCFGRVCVCWSAIVAWCTSTVVIVFHHWIFRLFTQDDSLINDLRSVMHIFALYNTCDNVQFTLQGIYRGAGRQDLAPALVLASLWLCGLPSAWLFGVFLGERLHGLLFGFTLGLSLEVPLLVLRMRGWDWRAIARDAARTEKLDGARLEVGGVELTEAAHAASSPQPPLPASTSAVDDDGVGAGAAPAGRVADEDGGDAPEPATVCLSPPQHDTACV